MHDNPRYIQSEPKLPAARILSKAEAMGEEMGLTWSYWVVEMNEATLARIRTQLDELAFNDTWEQGRSLTLDQVMALAFDTSAPSRPRTGVCKDSSPNRTEPQPKG